MMSILNTLKALREVDLYYQSSKYPDENERHALLVKEGLAELRSAKGSVLDKHFDYLMSITEEGHCMLNDLEAAQS
jgi:hypothetical protein